MSVVRASSGSMASPQCQLADKSGTGDVSIPSTLVIFPESRRIRKLRRMDVVELQ